VPISKFTMSGSNSLPTFVHKPIGIVPINMHYTAIRIGVYFFLLLIPSKKVGIGLCSPQFRFA